MAGTFLPDVLICKHVTNRPPGGGRRGHLAPPVESATSCCFNLSAHHVICHCGGPLLERARSRWVRLGDPEPLSRQSIDTLFVPIDFAPRHVESRLVSRYTWVFQRSVHPFQSARTECTSLNETG